MNVLNNTLNNSTKQSTEDEDGKENKIENTSTSATMKTNTKSTTASTLNNKLPNMLDSERLQSAITLWSRYLRRLSKNLVFEDITKIRDIFIKKLVMLESIVEGDYDNSDDKENGEDNNQQHSCNDNNNSPSLSESEIRATKAWSILKGM
ncbi:hypothetical protein RhiirA5_359449 [Rhizophagus irregularis]|nr:hypothetical protein RhiirA5_359449 [Rhizophagus irregularis]